MVTVEVKTTSGKIIESRTFLSYALASAWFERAKEVYEEGISITFGGDRHVVLR